MSNLCLGTVDSTSASIDVSLCGISLESEGQLVESDANGDEGWEGVKGRKAR